MFARLAEALEQDRAVVLASVLSSHGSTPRERAARMLIEADSICSSVGGGAMEGQVLVAARRLLADVREREVLTIQLDGRAGSAGVCGGGMTLALRRWQGAAMAVRARVIADALAAGQAESLSADELGAAEVDAHVLQPRPRLLILGAGHCGHALAQLAVFLEFEIVVADSRPECFVSGRFEGVTCMDASARRLQQAASTARDLYVVLVNRDYPTDVAALEALAGVKCAFFGMMGSARRILQVKQAMPQQAVWLDEIVAPVGLDIGEQTPHEIAVSILAQLIARRAGTV